MRPGEVPLVAPVRWGAQETKNVPAFDPVAGVPGLVDVAQFLDMKLLVPQQLSVQLYAVADVPVAGLSVRWTLTVGSGSVTHDEVFVQAVQDKFAQLPLSFVRSASVLRASAQLVSLIAALRTVKVVALVAPTAPTWLTDLTCTQGAT